MMVLQAALPFTWDTTFPLRALVGGGLLLLTILEVAVVTQDPRTT